MKRALLALLLAACVHTEKHDLDVHQAEHDELAGNVSLRLDAEQHAQIEGHEIGTTGPGERVEETFAPDGGIAKRVTTRWGPRTLEAWQTQAMGSDEHLELDAGVVAKHDASADVRKVDTLDRHPAGGCMLGLGFWGAVGIAVLLGGAILYLRLKP